MKKALLLLAVFSAITSCKKEIQTPENITVDLEVRNEDSPMNKELRSFAPIDTIPSNLGFKGIINKDSSLIAEFTSIYPSQIDKLVNEGVIHKDTLKNLRYKLYALSGFRNNKQYYIVDVNGNKDFSDDEIVEFSTEISSKISRNYKLIDSFSPTKPIKFHRLINGNLVEVNYPLVVFPDNNRLNLNVENEKIKKLKKHWLATVIVDYLFGRFSVNKADYKVATSSRLGRVQVIFSNTKDEFYKIGDARRENYTLNDTVELNKNYFRIDSLTNNPFQLHLKKLQITENVVGFRTGQVSKDFAIEDLEGNTTSLSKMFNNKDYLLIDFWGTWCGPCKELTPDIKDLYSKYNSKLELASIAYEQDPTPVKEYATANNFTWFNGIVKGKPKSGLANAPKLIKELRVQSFPTFLLLDKDLKIVHRTVGGGSAFEELENFIKNL